MDKKIIHNLKHALEGKKLIRIAHTIEDALDQSVVPIPQEIWYKYPTMGEDFIKIDLAKKGIKCIRPFPNSHRDKDYFFDHLIWKMIADNYIKDMDGEPVFFTYKNSTNLTEACFEYGFKEFMPDYKLFKEIQYKSNLEAYGVSLENGLIPFINKIIRETSYKEITKELGDKFVIQFSFAKSGWNTAGANDTFIVKSEEEFENVKKKIIDREHPAKISKFIDGYSICLNAVNINKGTVVSDLYLQVTEDIDMSKSTASNMSLSGANFAESYKYINKNIQKEAKNISRKIGEELRKKDYKGHFGVDFIVENKTNKVYVLEINPRFTGSTFIHTCLADKKAKIPFVALHLCSYLDCLPESFDIEEYEQGMENIWEGGASYIRNKENNSVQIIEAPRPGIYKINKNSIEFVREDYSLHDLPTKDHFLLTKLYPLKRNLSTKILNNILCKIYSLEVMFDGNSKILDKYKFVNEEIYRKFKFVPKNTYDSSVPYKVI